MVINENDVTISIFRKLRKFVLIDPFKVHGHTARRDDRFVEKHDKKHEFYVEKTGEEMSSIYIKIKSSLHEPLFC